MDEPTTALTRKEVESLFKVVRDLQKKGISIVFVSHKLEEVFEIAEKLTILRNGRKVIEGDMIMNYYGNKFAEKKKKKEMAASAAQEKAE